MGGRPETMDSVVRAPVSGLDSRVVLEHLIGLLAGKWALKNVSLCITDTPTLGTSRIGS